MSLPSLPQDVLRRILEILTLENVVKLTLVCKTLRLAVLEDRYLWHYVLSRDTGCKLSRLPTNAVPTQDASVEVLRTYVKHTYVLWRAYEHPGLDRAVIRIDTPARVTFVKLIRGRWFLVASSNTTISELSVWEIRSPSTCALRSRVYLPAPALDCAVDDGGSYVRVAISVGTCLPSIKILELAKRANGNVILHQLADVPGASRVLLLKQSTLFFSCLRGDDTWPILFNWTNGAVVRLTFSVGAASTFEYCAGLNIWKSYILIFTYSGLHIFSVPKQIPSSSTYHSSIISLALPRTVFRVTFLDDYSTADANGCDVINTRWVSKLNQSESAIFVLSYKESGNANSSFEIEVVLNPPLDEDPEEAIYRFALDTAVGSAGSHVISTSVVGRYFIQTPAYRIAPIRLPDAQSRFIDYGETHLSVVEPLTIPGDGLPSSRTISCLDFDDGHGLLLIGSDAGQFCLVNFTNALLPNEAIYGELPINNSIFENISKVPLKSDIPTYFSYRTRPEYGKEDCPSFVFEDALRHWGNAFADLPLIPGWSSDWSQFSLIKKWFLPPPLWSTHESVYRLGMVGHRIRKRLRSSVEIVPILYNVSIHAMVILRVGERVMYCRTAIWDEDFEEDDDEVSSQIEILGVLPVTFTEFTSSDTNTILSLINDRVFRRNLRERSSHASIERKEYLAKINMFAIKEAACMGKVPDAKTFDEWSDDDWKMLERRHRREVFAASGINISSD